MKNLQQKHKEWCEKNFGGREPKASSHPVEVATDLIQRVGKLAHHTLKARQGIRGSLEEHEEAFDEELEAIHSQSLEASIEGVEFDTAYGDGCWTHLDEPLLGVAEELGELLGCNLADRAGQIDAVGDIVLYLLDYCNKVGIDFDDAVRSTAEKVHARDWVSNPVNGEEG